MESLIVYPQNKEQLTAFKAFAKALNIKYEIIKKPPYNAGLLAKIRKSRKEVEEGKFITLDPTKSIWENLG
jgi:hypothetical protein